MALPHTRPPGQPYLYADSFPRGPWPASSPTSRGPFPTSGPAAAIPLVLNTGRTLYHWHGGTITRRVS